jgi:hypothetical protein
MPFINQNQTLICMHLTLMSCTVPCGIFDDPAIVNEIKQAAETIRKAMVQSNDLHSGLTASNSAQELNQMVSKLLCKSFHYHLEIQSPTSTTFFAFTIDSKRNVDI